jgi:hypothetical protein
MFRHTGSGYFVVALRKKRVQESTRLKMLELRTRKGYQLWGAGPALRIAAVAAFLAAECLRYRSSHLSLTRLEAIQIAEYAFVFFAAMALTALYAGFAERLRLHRFLQSPFLVFAAAVLLAAAVYKLGMYQFGGWDEGLLVHAATCYAQGFKPYVDFPCSMPPLFMAAIRCAIRLLGLRWTSLALIAASFTGLTALWIFALLRRAGVQCHWALVIAACVEMSTMLVVPFWWFNNSSAVSVVLLILSALACLRRPEQFFPGSASRSPWPWSWLPSQMICPPASSWLHCWLQRTNGSGPKLFPPALPLPLSSGFSVTPLSCRRWLCCTPMLKSANSAEVHSAWLHSARHCGLKSTFKSSSFSWSSSASPWSSRSAPGAGPGVGPFSPFVRLPH